MASLWGGHSVRRWMAGWGLLGLWAWVLQVAVLVAREVRDQNHDMSMVANTAEQGSCWTW